MKQVLFYVFLLTVTFCFRIQANNSGLFDIDERTINSELSQLTELEKYVEQNQGTTLSRMKAEGNRLATAITGSPADIFNTAATSKGPFGVPSFLWGLIGGPAGMLFVYLYTSKQMKEVLYATYGCLIWGTAIVLYNGLVRHWWFGL